MNKKKILIISSSDVNSASGIIAYDLHIGLAKKNRSEILTLHSKVKEEGVVSYNSSYQWFLKRLKNKIIYFLFKKIKTNRDYYFFDVDQNKSLVNINRVAKIVNKPDIIIAYFMGGFFTIKDLYNLQARYNNVPVFLVMADMIYITGGCHYSWDCVGYKEECSECPAIIPKKDKHYASDNLKMNKKLIDEMNVNLIALSSQDYEYAKQSSLFKSKKVSFILGGINLGVFNYKNNQTKLKTQNGVPANDFVILFGAVKVGEKRKGVKYFIEAINYLSENNKSNRITIVSIGNGQLEDLLPNTKFNIVNLGYISDYNKLSEVYNIADVFVTTTIQDSGPMMVNQAIACGTPVVCFDIGVARDIVINGKTGFRVELYNSVEIAKAIMNLYGLENNERIVIKENCSLLAKEKYSRQGSANNILKIIDENEIIC